MGDFTAVNVGEPSFDLNLIKPSAVLSSEKPATGQMRHKPCQNLPCKWKRLTRFRRNLICIIYATAIFTLITSALTIMFAINYWSLLKKPVVENVYNLKNKETHIHDSKLQDQLCCKEASCDVEVKVKLLVEEITEKQDDQIQNIFSKNINERQKAVVVAFKHAWKGYKMYAWGHDNLKPLSKEYYDVFGLGLTIIDSLDTMYIMGLEEEFEEAEFWVNNELEFQDKKVDLFEVTVKVLGGLLSAYHLSGRKNFLEKAWNLGDRLLQCFVMSPTGIPYDKVNLASGAATTNVTEELVTISEVTTLQLEFRDLSHCVHDTKYEEAAFKVTEYVHQLPKFDGLVPLYINPHSGSSQNDKLSLSCGMDSYYEYLLKQWIQTGKTIDFLRDDYLNAIKGIQNKLMKRTTKSNLLFTGEFQNEYTFFPLMEHLACFLPGTLALGYHNGLPEHHLRLAEDLMKTCYQTYAQHPYFLAPESKYFRSKSKESDKKNSNLTDEHIMNFNSNNSLRPECIESLWYLYQITGNTKYQDWGWSIFKAFEKLAKVRSGGYTSIGNVDTVYRKKTRPRNFMESYFLSETLKYFYLLFSDNRKLLDIDKYIMNTGGHPLPIYSS